MPTTVMFIIVVILLGAIALMLYRALRGGIILQIDEATRKLREAASNYGEVNAVTELARQLRNDPGLIRDLAAYPRHIVSAALIHRINTIANDLVTVQRELSEERDNLARYGSSYQNDVDRLEKLVEHLLEDLQLARSNADEFNSMYAAA